jgi:hypothetical protein
MSATLPRHVFVISVLYSAVVACYCITVVVTGPSIAMVPLTDRFHALPLWVVYLLYATSVVLCISMVLLGVYALFVCMLIGGAYLQIDRSPSLPDVIAYFVNTTGAYLFYPLVAMVFSLPGYFFLSLTSYHDIVGRNAFLFTCAAMTIGAVLSLARYPIIRAFIKG